MKQLFLVIILLPSCLLKTVAGDEPTDSKESASQDSVTFEKHIRPILKASCFACHGEDTEEELHGGLDIRLRRLILKGGESGPAIVPGDFQNSLLHKRIQSGEMPPGKAQLSEQDVRTIAKWIQMGAKTSHPEPENPNVASFTHEERNFWSFQPIRRSGVPSVQHANRSRTAIDRFLLAKLEEHKLTFATDADKPTLIRRVCFDLLGLPPTRRQIGAFLADESPDAYDRLIDRLLASPRYGERWGRHWLDVAGYADSEGYTDADVVRNSAFRYRDYVIRSHNADKPFDQFIREQLAGDEMVKLPYRNLAPEDIEKLVATGFLRMAADGTGSGGIDQGLARNQVVAETLKIVSTSMMGLTIGCSQCHNHRYDPISQQSYYRFRAIFEPAYDWKNWRNPAARKISLYTDEDRKVAAQIEVEAKKIDTEREKKTREFIDQTLENQLRQLAEDLREPLRVAYKTVAKKRTDKQNNLLESYPKILKISAGSLYLYDREIRAEAAKIDSERVKKQKEFVERAFERRLQALDMDLRQPLRIARSTPSAKRSPTQTKLLAAHSEIVVTAATLHKFDTAAAGELQNLKKAADDLRATQKADRVKTFQDRAAAIRARKPIEGFMRVLNEAPGKIPATFLFYRGDHEQPRQKLLPAGLAVLDTQQLSQISENDETISSSGRRLAFARRLTSKSHPLTARVIVNRVWLHHFGRGLVATPGDFGFLGARPTHPRLLDWLAAELIDSGWSLKQLHRLIVSSTAYRQSSQHNVKHDTIDPDNRLYGRMAIRRLESEVIRDAILAMSDKLNDKLYGEPVPVMEDDVGQIIIGKENLDGERKPGATISLNGEEFRRSIYIQVRRSRPLDVLDAFDSPAMDPNCTIRNSSTVAPQALMLMNGQFSTQYARYFAERMHANYGKDPIERIRAAWTIAFGRQPTKKQLDESMQFLTEQARYYDENRPQGVTGSPELMALASFCRVLISSNRFLYVD